MYGKEPGKCILSYDTHYCKQTKDIDPIWYHPQHPGFSKIASSRWHRRDYTRNNRGWMTGAEAWGHILSSNGKLTERDFMRCPDKGRPDYNFLVFFVRSSYFHGKKGTA